jgi:Fe2+ or Zn2+ uptake regulation protein
MSIETRFVARKQFPSGVRKIVTGACKRPASVKSLASTLSKERGKRVAPETVVNTLRWLQWKGYVTRHGDEERKTRKPAVSKRAGKNKKRTVH